MVDFNRTKQGIKSSLGKNTYLCFKRMEMNKLFSYVPTLI